MYGLDEEHIESREDEDALGEYANWSRSEDGHRIYRLTPSRSTLLFGPGGELFEQALARSALPLTMQYKMVGNMVAPITAQACIDAITAAGVKEVA